MLQLVSYRDIWLSEKMHEVIGFYPREFYCFDNFSSFKVEYKGYIYSTVEEAYQAIKFIDNAPEVADEIKKSFSSDEAKRIAERNKKKQNPNWNKIKFSVMEELIRLKVEQNPYVKKKLLETEDYMIVEDSPKDDVWGWGKERNGQNRLGKIWMKIREEIK